MVIFYSCILWVVTLFTSKHFESFAILGTKKKSFCKVNYPLRNLNYFCIFFILRSTIFFALLAVRRYVGASMLFFNFPFFPILNVFSYDIFHLIFESRTKIACRTKKKVKVSWLQQRKQHIMATVVKHLYIHRYIMIELNNECAFENVTEKKAWSLLSNRKTSLSLFIFSKIKWKQFDSKYLQFFLTFTFIHFHYKKGAKKI